MPSELTPEFLADYETPLGIRLSPSASHVVYTFRSFWVRKAKTEHITASLWIAEVGKENSARQLTQGKCHDRNPQFSPDGKYISFVSDRAKPGKGGALYLMPMDAAGEGLPLTGVENEKGVGEHRWSPDAKQIAFISADEKGEEKKKREEEKDDAKVWGEEWEYGRLRILNVESKEVRTLVSEEAHVAGFDWSEDGKRLAFYEHKTPMINDVSHGKKIKVVDVRSGEVKWLCEFGAEMGDLTWRGESVYWKGKYDGKTAQTSTSIWRAEVGKEGLKPENIAYGEDNCASGLRTCGDELLAYVCEGLSDQLRVVGSKTLYDEDIDICRGWDAAVKGGKVTVAIIKAEDTAMPLEVFSIVEGRQCQLSNHNKQLTDYKLAKSSSLRCKASDGTPLDGVLSIPSTLLERVGPYPTVVVPHGGPYVRVTRGLDWCLGWTEWLLSLGYVVLQPNYRGGSGRGAKFAEAVVSDVAASYSDCIDLLKKAIADGVVDEKRVAIAGWSQGGFLSYLAPTRDSTFHFVAAIPGAGISDWDTMALTSDVPTFEATLSGVLPWMTESTDTQSRNGSAIYHMQNIKTPYLILHGEQDQRVPVEQAIGFHRGLMAKGKECEMVIYPREGHGVPMPFERVHYIHMLVKIKTFLEKYMK